MPPAEARARDEKHYGGPAKAGSNTDQTSTRPVPANARRVMLFIQNTGTNPGLVRFGEPIQGDGSDMLFEAGAGLLFDRPDAVPQSAINIGSALGTTFCIIESNKVT